MKKFVATLTAIVMVLFVIYQPVAQAASNIKIYIDGNELVTDQAPVLIGNYTFVPLRGIFEALNAEIIWNQVTKTVTAKKKDTTIVLQIGSNTATINNQIVPLQSPARILNNRTIVPVRFISESFGGDVKWNQQSQSVVITTPIIKQVNAVTSLNATIISQYGDGRDVQISFRAPSDTSNVKHYRALVVKEANASAMNLARAQIVREANYTTISTASNNPTLNLSSQSRDVDGALISANQAYKVFILTVGDDIYALSNPSSTFTLTQNSSLSMALNVSVQDIGDYGDSRDLRISFTRAVDEARINSYRIFIVREADYTRFNVSEAIQLSSGRFYDVTKSGSNSYSQTLPSTIKDVKGNAITNGVAYRAFVLGVNTNNSANRNVLSAASASITLVNSSITSITNLAVSDVSDYKNGMDLRVDFSRISNESNLKHYRIFVVRESRANSFTLSSANAVTDTRNYTVASITGNNFSSVLSSGTRDVNGTIIQNGISYRVFVMSVGGGSLTGTNVLSAYSSAITLTINSVTAVTNVSVSDVSNNNNGLDLRVDFTKAPNETFIDQYRIYVVKDVNASRFNLSSAIGVTNSNNYTIVPKTGNNVSRVLLATSRDVNGDLIQNGISYRIFIVTLGSGNASGTNVLSAQSSSIVLYNTGVVAVSSINVSDVNNNNNGSDLQVDFNKAADESNISQYRIFVVKDSNASSFNLTTANAITSNMYYTAVSKTGNNISQVLPSSALDVNGASIQNNVAYRIFVLTVESGGSSSTNALSAQSSAITLYNTIVLAPTAVTISDVSDNNNGTDLLVAFDKAADESNVNHYRIFVVKDSNAASFNLTTANAINNSIYYTAVSKTGNSISQILASGAVDVNGASIQNGVAYRVFVQSINNNNSTNALSIASNSITLTTAPISAPIVQNVTAQQIGVVTDLILVSFTPPADETGISYYAVLIVPGSVGALTDTMAINSVTAGAFKRVEKAVNITTLTSANVDVHGAPIVLNVEYQVYVLSVTNGATTNQSKLSTSVASVLLNP